jgi:hypothetical protein
MITFLIRRFLSLLYFQEKKKRVYNTLDFIELQMQRFD